MADYRWLVICAVLGCGDDGGSQTDGSTSGSTSTTASTTTMTTTSTTAMTTTSTPTSGTDSGTDAESTETGAQGEPCNVVTMASDLSGVSIEVMAPTCTFTVAQAQAGIEIEYAILVDADIAGVFPDEYGSANCTELDALQLLVSERLFDDGDSVYCVCDKGLCPPWTPPEVTVPAGVYVRLFEWEGHAWNGPSDTRTPYGDPFPPGTYRLELRAIGQFADPDNGPRAFEVLTEAEVVLTP